MQIWPAVEIRSGKCVRPSRGDYLKETQTETVYGENPADMAVRWINDGALGIHVVDLNAAIGEPGNFEAISKIAEQTDVPIQLGGGIRDELTIKKYLEKGIARLVIGTQAIKDPNWFFEMSEKYPEHILLGLDSCEGLAITGGRLEKTELLVSDFARRMALHPIAGIVFADIAKSGILDGPNFETLKQLRETIDAPVIACGGVATVADASKLATMGISGCVIGRALYEGRVTLAEIQNQVHRESSPAKTSQNMS